jgi:transcriptional regulator with XRE-family HTH domain
MMGVMSATLHCPESTVRVEVLGEELRRLRELCGLTLAQVVARIGISETALSRWETGRRAPSPEDVSALLVIYGITGEERRELLALARRSGQPGLWQRQGNYESRFETLKLLETRATRLVNVEPLVLPGLLQTVPYARATVRDVALIKDEEEIDNRVIGRIHRQAMLRKLGAPHLTAIVTETALRNQVGGAGGHARSTALSGGGGGAPENLLAGGADSGGRPPRPEWALPPDAVH